MPADDPKVTVYVAIDNAHNVTQYGGSASAPVARNVFLSAIDIFNISPSKEVMPKEYTWLDQKYLKLPNVVGMDIDDAKKTLKSFQINYSGNGNKVIYASPEEGSYVKENGFVTLLLG